MQLGTSVSITGDGTRLLASGVGEAIIYGNVNNEWIIRDRLSNRLVDNTKDAFKSEISRDGSFLIVGSPSNNTVQVFCLEDDGWRQKGLTVQGDYENDNFGFGVSVANRGEKILVSALGGGYARAYTYESPQWIYDSKTHFGDGSPNSRFGFAISISGSGDYSVLGAPSFNSNIGMVQGYDMENQDISEQISDVSDTDAEFGAAVAITEDAMTLAIGAPGIGIVYIYRMNTVLDKWIQLDNNIFIDSGRFGSSLSFAESGTKIIVGDPGNSLNGGFAGASYVFEYDPLPVDNIWKIDGTWKQITTAFYGENENDKCGTDVSLSADGKKIVTSCPGFDGGRGIVCVYTEQVDNDNILPTLAPSMTPSKPPTIVPAIVPTMNPSSKPSYIPTTKPSDEPTTKPSEVPSTRPSEFPTTIPSITPSTIPSTMPSIIPSIIPSITLSITPSIVNSGRPSTNPTTNPTFTPTKTPTKMPVPTSSGEIPISEAGPLAIFFYLIASTLTFVFGFLGGIFGNGLWTLLLFLRRAVFL